MKTSYTKRALAFWLAVAMLATGAPAALAREPDTGTGGSTSVSGTTTTPTTPGGQDDAGAGQDGGEVTTSPAQSVKLDHITLSSSSVIVTGGDSAAQTVTATAYSSAENTTAIDNSKITWSISGNEGSGVRIDSAGKITVDAKAKAGNYTVTATAKTDTNTTETQTADATVTGTATATLTVARHGEHVATSVIVSDGAASLEIPSDDTVVGTNFTATAQDAFDNKLAVTWSVETTQPDKVSIDSTGKLTVKKGATSETVIVKATCGDKFATKSVELKYAASVLQKITEVWMSGQNTYVDVTDGLTLEAGESATLFVKGLDQYGKEITVTDKITVVAKSDSSTNLDFTGNKIIAKGQTQATETVIVKYDNNLSKDIQVTVRPATTQATEVKFATQPDIINTYGDLITEPTITVNGETPEDDSTVRYEYREIADKPANTLSNDTLTTMPRDVGKYQVTAYYDSKDGSKHGSASTTFEITKKPVTVTTDNKTITKGDAIPTLTFSVPSGALVNGDKQDALGVKLTTTATSSSPAGTYDITGTADSKNYAVTVTPGKLTIKAETGIRMVAGKSSEDSNRSRYDLSVRRGTGYLDLNADADDYLNRQTVDGSKDYWIGFDLDVYLDGASKNIQDLYVSSTGKSTEWKKISDLNNSRRYIGDFYLDNLSGTSFTLWFDTDDDSDNSDRLYFATSSSGANEYYIDVDFDAYRGSSSSSSGSSSSDTSKKDGDRVSTTTIDKTPSVKSRSATVTFSSSAMSDALDENKREARHEDADVTYIELDARTSKTVDDTTITVPRKSLDNIADEDTGLILTTNHGTFTFDDRALAEIYDTCDKTNIDFYIEEEDDDQYIVLIKDGSDDVIDLGSGEVEIVFDYRLKSGEKSSDVNVYRIGDGDKEFDYARDMKADYSSSKKEATFTTDTLGTFLVTTDTLKTGSDSSTTTTPPTTPSYSRFVDVPSSRWSATYINKLASLGIINGTGGGYFEPTLQVTREEFVKMLAGVAGANVTGYTSSRFPDVPMSRWSASYIAWAADRGITTGTDGGRFAPTMKITREEMATMIYRYVQISGKTLPAKNAPVTFADADQISSWAQTAVSVMQQAGIIDGNVTNGRYTFDPKVPASREECAKMLSILYDLL